MNFLKKKICILNYGVGNIESVKQAFEYQGAEVLITNDSKKIISASRLVLPGVGAFKPAMQKLKKLNLLNSFEIIKKKEIPLLGICLGMQLLMDKSYEFGETSGLKMIPGEVIKVPEYFNKKKIIVPYIGWSKINHKKHFIMENIEQKKGFYFIHSFMAVPKNPKNIIASYSHKGNKIVAIISKNNFLGCQFHPEKSGKDGLCLIKNFLKQ